MNKALKYVIPLAQTRPSLTGQWRENAWRNVPVATISHFHQRSSEHRPRVEAKLTYMPDSLFVFFKVHDRYVRSVHTEFQSSVCLDSCVEFFVEPKPGKGYLNFEINCGGTLLVYYIEDPTRAEHGFKKYTIIPWEQAQQIQIYHSLPAVVEPEITEPVEWNIEYRIPFQFIEEYVGPLGALRGQQWRGNLYKCADQTSHPHWATWAPLGDKLAFHLPEYFAPLHFQ